MWPSTLPHAIIENYKKYVWREEKNILLLFSSPPHIHSQSGQIVVNDKITSSYFLLLIALSPVCVYVCLSNRV